ncbi:hypothetical protein PV04_09141 [Phialophora macrospora]|uniref:DUF302 domain-containing protein n=1 Tax=Phialophora macrospora TaxID=1851006 RepID=A0A0D2F847_9EURO|nr:hypothetical protein PV04_09141 [Phialophora macrospora]
MAGCLDRRKVSPVLCDEHYFLLMEHERQFPSASSDGHPESESSASARDPESQPTHDTAENNGDSVRSSWSENRAVELYCEVLLGRAHFLFFHSILEDVDFRTDLFVQGRAALEEAETLCMSDRYSVSDQLIAKCWYIRGFLADASGDGPIAAESFEQATKFDGRTYANLNRVRWYQQRQENDQELDDLWDELDQSSDRGKKSPRPGEAESNDGFTKPGVASNSPDVRKSALFNFLELDIKNRPRPQDSRSGRMETPPRPPTTPTTVHHSPPIDTPPHARGSGAVDVFMKQLIEEPSRAKRRASEETHKILMQHINSPEKDPSLIAAAREDRRRAMQEAAEREQIQRLREQLEMRRESTAKKNIKRPSRQVAEEALLSDTPSVGELDTRFMAANRSATSPTSPVSPTLTIKTHGSFDSWVQSRVGPHGFMYFDEYNHTRWLAIFEPPTVTVVDDNGEKRFLKAIRFILGNPAIALTMLRHDLNAGLCVPVELYLAEEAEGGVRVVWYKPTGLIAGYEGAKQELVDAANALSVKLETFIRWVLREDEGEGKL